MGNRDIRNSEHYPDPTAFKAINNVERKREKYTVGSSPVPHWCRKSLTPYLKLNGCVGYEYRGRTRNYELEAGDMLILNGGKVDIRRRNPEGVESESIFTTSKKD